MTQKRYFYDTMRDTIAVVYTDEDGVEFVQDGALISRGVEEIIYSDTDIVEVTKDNADLFIDAVLKLQDEQIRENQRLQEVHDILEGLLD